MNNILTAAGIKFCAALLGVTTPGVARILYSSRKNYEFRYEFPGFSGYLSRQLLMCSVTQRRNVAITTGPCARHL